MKPNAIKRFFAGITLSVALAGAWVVGGSLFRDVQFARAQDRVDATRQQLANVQDLAAVYKAVGKAVEPSVVSIDVRKTVQTSSMLRRFFRGNGNGNGNDGMPDMPDNMLPPEMPQQFQQQGTGSGVIMETDGNTAYIVTNNHVAGGATDMVVNLWDGREIKNAKLVGADPKSDIAVVKIEADHLIPAKWGNSDKLEKGDIVMAFGSPFGFVGSMTHGIVSALHRQGVGIISGNYAYENFIQVDAPINPGNSGGPLVDLKGEVIGINTAIATETGQFAGIGFAVPSNQAKFVYDAIKNNGKVVRGWLGVAIEDVSKEQGLAQAQGYTGENGILVRQIMKDTPAAGKLQPGDIITEMNGKKLENTQALRSQVAATAPGTEVKFTINRNGKQQDVSVKLGEQPEDTQSVASAGQGSNGNRNPSAAESMGLRLGSPTADTLQRYSLDSSVQGAVVTAVQPNSPAQLAGLAPGDVITQVGSTEVKNADDAREALSKQDLKKGIKLYVTNRQGSSLMFMRSEEQ